MKAGWAFLALAAAAAAGAVYALNQGIYVGSSIYRSPYIQDQYEKDCRYLVRFTHLFSTIGRWPYARGRRSKWILSTVAGGICKPMRIKCCKSATAERAPLILIHNPHCQSRRKGARSLRKPASRSGPDWG